MLFAALSQIAILLFTMMAITGVIYWLRLLDRPRLQIMLLFLTIAGYGLIYNFTGIRAGFATREEQFLMSLIALQPYLFLRVASNIIKIRTVILRLHLAIVILLEVYIWAFPRIQAIEADPYFMGRAGMIAYIIVMIPYAGGLLWKASVRSGGITRSRLRYAAIGTLFYAVTILLEALNVLSFRTTGGSIGEWLSIPLTGLASAIAFSAGFFPPRMVRNGWQLQELTGYLRAIRIKLLNASQTQLFTYLRDSSLRAVGGDQAAYGTLDFIRRSITFSPDGTSEVVNLSRELASLLDTLWNAGRPYHITRATSRDLDVIWERVGGSALYIVPVRAPRSKVMLFLGLRSASLFVDDDLGLLGLYVDQTTILLEYNALLEKQRDLVSSLRGYGASLETKVAERTAALQKSESELSQRVAQLTALNTELEAFSYSVSHDLRAPLRAINGFSRALVDDYGSRLDDEGNGYLERVLAASKRMDRLIDDLLKLSRLSRQQFQRTLINISEMCQHIIDDLSEMNPEYIVDVNIQPTMTAFADAQLVRILLENLLGNAWKFTGRTEYPRIVVSMERDVFKVSDNGAGFDPIYAKRLFVAFQRLHSGDEFEGTGVGLATVLRIVNRHGGRVWAEGALNDGATFYFTLN